MTGEWQETTSSVSATINWRLLSLWTHPLSSHVAAATSSTYLCLKHPCRVLHTHTHTHTHTYTHTTHTHTQPHTHTPTPHTPTHTHTHSYTHTHTHTHTHPHPHTPTPPHTPTHTQQEGEPPSSSPVTADIELNPTSVCN